MIQEGYFFSSNNALRFWELEPDLLNCFDRADMYKQITELLSCHYNSKSIEFGDIDSVMKSKYKDMVLDGIEYFGYSIISPMKNLCTELDLRGIKYFIEDEKGDDEYVPFNGGCIHEKDFPYIKEKKIGYIEVAQYTDGWYSCLPYVDVFTMFNRKDIQKDYLNIIHEAMFARCPSKTYIGSWYLLIGNVIDFLKTYEIDVDYSKLYGIFVEFLEVSLIWH